MKKILLIGAEAMPFAATGGLGDVLGSLPVALSNAGGAEVDVRVVLPLYQGISSEWRTQMTLEIEYHLFLSWRKQYCGVYRLYKDGVTYYFIDNEYYFQRDSLYGCFDDGERFAFFCKAAIDMLGKIGFYPDVLHAHDWHSALSLIYLERKYRQIQGYARMKTLFTIHNIEYQGNYDFGILEDIFELSENDRPIVEYNGRINLMKGAIVLADRVSTVSPRYAEEICTAEYAHGLHPILKENKGKLCGILNGIDYEYYNPQNDPSIEKNFHTKSLEGKKENKTALQKELCLPLQSEIPMLSMISRLVSHKGLDLISEIVYNIIKEQDVQLVVLGKGEMRYEKFFTDLQEAFPDKVRALITYDRALSKRIYAAADIFLMPSRSEPCGLSQMIASRYGAIPVTRETGGLYDSIKPYWEGNGRTYGNGFTFANYRSEELSERTLAAIELWRNEKKRISLVKRIMETDFSWNTSATRYLELYQSL